MKGKKKGQSRRQWSGKWPKQWKKAWTPPQVGRILPNVVTITALCMGLSAIQFAFVQQWQHAVASVILAGILDGIDGRLARFFKTSSEFGAELDSLADFINFGVAPSLINYFFTLSMWGRKGWGICLFFSACMALRLARFNVQRHYPSSSLFATGIPAPAGALLALSPIMSGFVFDSSPVWVFALVILFTSVMLISRYPTFIFKKIVIPDAYMGLFFIGVLALVVGVISAPWETALVVVLLYMMTLPISGFFFYKKGLS